MRSPSQRVVQLAPVYTSAGRPSKQNLQLLLQELIDQNGFDGIVGLYLIDLQIGEELHFGYQAGQNFSVNPDIAFTAASTMKIPIMVTAYQHFNGRLDDQTSALMLDMIQKSENTSADALMQIIDQGRGPLVVTETMQALGLQNTFLAGFFCNVFNPCPLLQIFHTPANQRTDVNADPDIYNQTTPSDIGSLLEDIYQCAQTGGGTLVAAFPGQIDQTACQQMIHFLEEDTLGALIQAGVPEGTAVAHKHGWISNNGVINNFSDAAIVYTPGGNYVLTIYAYHPIQAVWDPVTHMFVDISKAIYNYFNLPTQ